MSFVNKSLKVKYKETVSMHHNRYVIYNYLPWLTQIPVILPHPFFLPNSWIHPKERRIMLESKNALEICFLEV